MRITERKGSRKEVWALEGLAASGPYPGLEKKLALFGQFVGDWDILENHSLKSDGTWSKNKGAIHWRWILEGRAVQDIWTSVSEKSGKEIPWGTTVRFYDPKTDAWQSTWLSPRQGAVKSFIGRKVGDEIVLERSDDDGTLYKWIFSEITSDSFQWRALESRNGKRWMVTERMRVRRRR